MRLALRLGIGALIAALTFIACSTAPAGASGGGSKVATVTIKGFAFSPGTLTVDKGTAVTFTNQDTTNHTVSSGASRTKDGKFDQTLSGGTETTITFDTAGTFAYFCNIHASMSGTVVVK